MSPLWTIDAATDTDTPTVAVSPTAMAQLEVIRDQWLAPLVARIEELSHDNGRLQAERNALAADRDRLAEEVARERGLADQLVDLWQEERDAARAELDRLRSTQDALQGAPGAAGAEEPTDPAFRPSVAAWRERTTRAVDVDAPEAAPPRWRFWGGRR